MLKLLGVALAAGGIFIGQSADAAYCREFTQYFTVGNEKQEGYGTACLQPDGAWKIMSYGDAVSAPAPVVQEKTRVVVHYNRPLVRYYSHPFHYKRVVKHHRMHNKHHRHRH